MTNVAFPSIEDYRDIEPLMRLKIIQKDNCLAEKVLEAIHARSLSNGLQLPMLVLQREIRGLLSVRTTRKLTQKKQYRIKISIFHYYKKLIEWRKTNPVVVYGKYELILADDERIYAYTRTLEEEQLPVICTFSDGEAVFHLPETLSFTDKEILIANYD